MKMASVGMLSVLLLSVFYSFVSSLYFHIGDTERKCFIEELPRETMILGNFWTQLYDEQRDENLPPNQDLRIDVEARDPDHQVILSRSYGSEGSFRFTSWTPGGHQICLQRSNSSQPAGDTLALHLYIRRGERTNNYSQIAANEKLTELQLRVRQLAEQVLQIQKELDYNRWRATGFFEVNQSTNMWIFWWPVARSLYVVLLIIWSTKSW